MKALWILPIVVVLLLGAAIGLKALRRARRRRRRVRTVSPPPTVMPASSGPITVAGLVYDRDKVAWGNKERILKYFPSLNRPKMVPASEARHMRSDDTIVGIYRQGQARAYPWWILKNHHVLNEVVDREPVLVTFCENCSGAAAFTPVINGRTHTFHLIGVYNGTNLIADFETGSIWAPYDGVSLDGPLRLPIFQTTWEEWRERYPDTLVAWGHAKMREGHGSEQYIGKPGIGGAMRQSMVNWDERLPENELVLGVTLPGAARAYPLAELEKAGGPVNDVLAGEPIVAFSHPSRYLAIAFSRALEGRILEFTAMSGARGSAVARDRETGSTWSLDGRALDGPLQGARLSFIASYLTEWHPWASYHPNAEIFRNDGPARPRS